MGTRVNIQLQRGDMAQPWGFRLQGGKDFRQDLSVKKVMKGSPAEGRLNAGDAILAIAGYDATQLTHVQAQQMIKSSGAALDMTVSQGQYRSIKPTGPLKFSPAAAYGPRPGY